MSVDRASQFPVRTALSGPAAGAVGAAGAGRQSQLGDIITLDIGGTSTDVCLIQDGKTTIAGSRDISGFRIRLPMVDIHTVGAGGGSIATLGADGLMKVGPESAGAVPGPACYGRGGTLPTVSDANVILGRLPVSLTGGGMTVDRQLALEAVEPLATQLNISVEQAALGIVGIVTSNMVRAIRAVTIEKGYDPRRFTLMPFGGAGGLHAADVARSLGMSRIIIPSAPGILCAEGLIVSDLQEDFITSYRVPVDGDMKVANTYVSDLVKQGQNWLAQEGRGAVETRLILSLDMRYIGQNYELGVQVSNSSSQPTFPTARELKEAFFAEYRRSYGHYDADAPVEIINLRLRAVAKLPQIESVNLSPNGPVQAFHEEQVWFDDGGPVPTPLYERSTLAVGTSIAGPAIITQLDATTVVPPGSKIMIDPSLNMIMEVPNV